MTQNFKATLHCLVYLNHICVCFRAWLLAVCVLVKVSQGSQNLGGLAVCAATVHCVTSLCQLLQHQRQAGLSCLTACPGASPKTRWRNLSLVSIVSINIEHWQTEYVCCGTWPRVRKNGMKSRYTGEDCSRAENCPSDFFKLFVRVGEKQWICGWPSGFLGHRSKLLSPQRAHCTQQLNMNGTAKRIFPSSGQPSCMLRTKANSSSCSCVFESCPYAEAWLAGTLAIPTGSRPNEETSIRAATLANVTRAWQSTLATPDSRYVHSTFFLLRGRDSTVIKLRKINKNSFHRPLRCTLPVTTRQNEARVLQFYTWQFFVIFLILRLC